MSNEDFNAAGDILKKRFVGTLVEALPSEALTQKDIPFDSAEQLGDEYVRAVRVQRPQGHTFAGSTLRGTAYSINTPVAGLIKQAKAKPTSYLLTENVSYDLLRSAKDREQAFISTMDMIHFGMRESSAWAQEVYNLYGGDNIGTLDLTDDSGAGTTTYKAKITKATWAAGLFVQAEGAFVDIYESGGSKLNSSGTIQISKVNCDTREITFTASATADTTAIAGGTTPVIVPKGASGEWGDGIYKILSTGAGSTIHGLSTDYGIWRCASHSADSAAAKFRTFSQAAAKVLPRGGAGEIKFYVSPWTFEDLNQDSMEFRQDVRNKGGEFEIGNDKIAVRTSSGLMTIVPHIMVKAGHALGLRLSTWKRIGTTDHTFSPGGGGQVIFDLESNAGKQLRCGWDCTPFCSEPAKNVLITDIVNNSLT